MLSSGLLGDILSSFRGRLRASRAPPEPQNGALPRTKSLSKPNLTYSDLSCQVWVLSLAFPGFGGGQVSFRVCATKTKMRPRFGAIFTGSQALGLRITPAEPQPQICCGARAVGKTLVTHFAVIGARLGDPPWRLPGTSPGFPGTSNSSHPRAAAHKVSVETKFDLHWPCPSGLGSIWYFSGFWRGHGVI